MEVFRTVEEEEEEEPMLSECSSGCESGWTIYLDGSEGGPWEVDNEAVCSKRGREEGGEDEEAEEEEEDGMSTVSDASSGPPVFQETDVFSGRSSSSSCSPYYCCFELDSCSCPCRLSTSCGGDHQHGVKRRRIEQQQENKQLRLYNSFRDLLEDTATSPLPGYQALYADPNSISAGSGLLAADTDNLRLSIACSSPTPARALKTRFSPEEHALSSTTSFMARTHPKQE